jgi:hypothetical protein
MRTTNAQLNSLVLKINQLTGNPIQPWDFDDEAGKYKPNAGNFHLDHAYDGVRLEQHLEGGGVTVPLNSGYISKREMATQLRAFIAGLKYGKE